MTALVSRSFTHARSRSHFEKGLTDIYARNKTQRKQIQTLQSEKEELKNKLLKQALDALGGGSDTGSVSAQKYAALQQELEEAKRYKATQNSCILELNGKLAAVQHNLQLAEDRLKTPLTGDAAAVQVANLHKELGDKAARIKELEASVELGKKLAKEKDATMQKLADQLAVSSQLDGPIHSKTHLAEIQAERERADAAEARLEEALKVKKVYEAEVMALEAAKEELDERWLAQSDELRKVRADLDWAENEKGELEEDLLEIMRQSGKSAMDAFQEQNDKIAQLTQELASTQELLDNAQHELMDYANDRDRLQEKNDVLKSKLNEANKKLATETRQNKAHQNRIGVLEADLRNLEDDLRAIKRKSEQSNESSTKLQEIQEENEKLARTNRKATRQADDVKRDVSDLKREVKDLQAQLEATRKAESAAESAAEQKLASLKKQHRTELFNVEQGKKESDKQVNLLNYDMAKLKNKIIELEDDKKQLAWEKNDLVERMGATDDTETQLETLRREKTNLATTLDSYKKKITLLEEKLAALNEALEREKELTQTLDGLVAQLRAGQAKPKENGVTPSYRSEEAPIALASSTPAAPRATSVASSTTSKLPAGSRDQSAYTTKSEFDMTEEDWKNFATRTRKRWFFKPGSHACSACK